MIKVGDKFVSFASFSEKLELYKKQTFSEYWIRDCRTLENHARKLPVRAVVDANKQLKYYYVRFSCIMGGRVHIPRNKIRSTKTFRQNCKAGMFLKVTDCGKFLELKELIESHSHELSYSCFQSLPQQRLKIPMELKIKSLELLRAGANKKIVQNNIIRESGCLVTLDDLTNMKRKTTTDKNFEECVNILKNNYNCDVQILIKDDNLECLYFQDPEMKTIFSAYPEIIFTDGTYCLHDNYAATYMIMVEDSEGCGHIVAVAILLKESQEVIEWFLQTFYNNNSSSSNVQVVMSDKDASERNAIRKIFPNASLHICLFHTLQIFNREVSAKKMGLTKQQCDTSRSLLQELAYSTSYENYHNTYLELINNEHVPQTVVDYFDKNWKPIVSEWVLYLTFNNLCFMNKTNNKLENINKQLKSIISRYSKLENFIENFFILLKSLRVNRNVKCSQSIHKVSTEYFEYGSPLDLYSQYLTSYAFDHVRNQLLLESKVNISYMDSDVALIHSSEGSLLVSSSDCCCLFRSSMSLPCRHIFKFRRFHSLPLFEIGLCLKRWTKSYFNTTFTPHTSFSKSINQLPQVIIQKNKTKDTFRKPLNNHQKYKGFLQECIKLAQITSEVSTDVYHQRINSIKQLQINWAAAPNDFNTISDSHNYKGSSNIPSSSSSLKNTEHNSIHYLKSWISTYHNYCKPLSSVTIPRVVIRGRPKSLGRTVIGLKKKN